jgi:hypothetical protein
METTR